MQDHVSWPEPVLICVGVMTRLPVVPVSDVIAAVGFEMPTRKRMNSYTAVTTHFNSIYMNNILKSTFAFYNAVHHAAIIPILPDFEKPVGTFDTQQIPYIIQQGEKATEAHIPYIRQLVSNQK